MNNKTSHSFNPLPHHHALHSHIYHNDYSVHHTPLPPLPILHPNSTIPHKTLTLLFLNHSPRHRTQYSMSILPLLINHSHNNDIHRMLHNLPINHLLPFHPHLAIHLLQNPHLHHTTCLQHHNFHLTRAHHHPPQHMYMQTHDPRADAHDRRQPPPLSSMLK